MTDESIEIDLTNMSPDQRARLLGPDDPIEPYLAHLHPVERSLIWDGTTKVEQAVLKYGRPFTGIERPKGYRQRAMKKCFTNSADVADGERGVYVEGFALTPIAGKAVHHGWVTLDGVHAIDVTFKDAPKCWFFGIPFSEEVVGRWVTRWAGYLPLIDPYASDEEIEELLQDALSNPPIFS
jgi:hypothetical protein